MSILTLSTPIKEILEKIGGEPENRAVELLISGIKENLKECELEILEFETKYGYSFDVFKEKLASGHLGDEFSYSVEKDAMRWEDLIIEKKNWIEAIKKIEHLMR
ncbi:MAG: hypothetical protein HY755_06330 [Nitrospirae bacterium]|nr:hypothetical protein [Nitrospirota bacterium]